MSFSIETKTGDGVTASFSVPFPYILETHVLVSVDSQVVGYEFTSPSQITFTTPPADGADILIQRKTPADELLAIITGRSTLKSAELNLVYTQLLYIMQEVFDVGDDLQVSTLELNNTLAQINAIATTLEAIETNVETIEGNVEAIAQDIATTYDLLASIPYAPLVNEEVFTAVIPRALSLSAITSSTLAYTSNAASTNSAVFSVRVNGVEVGTVTFATSASVGVLSVTSAVSIAAGARVSLVCTQADAALQNFSITLPLTRVA